LYNKGQSILCKLSALYNWKSNKITENISKKHTIVLLYYYVLGIGGMENVFY